LSFEPTAQQLNFCSFGDRQSPSPIERLVISAYATAFCYRTSRHVAR